MRPFGWIVATASLGSVLVACHHGGTTGTTSGASTGSGGGTECKPTSVDGIELAPIGTVDPTLSLGYPPYAVDGCNLVYLAPGQGPGATGELRVRDLGSGMERVIADASLQPSRPAISGTRAAWEAIENGTRVVKTVDLAYASATPMTIVGPFDHAGEPRVSEGSVVFTAWVGAADTSDTGIFVFSTASATVQPVATGPGQRRFADISPTHIAWSDFSVGPTKIFADQSTDAANIVVLERASGVTNARTKPGKQAFPMLGIEGKVAYLDWGLVHPEPKFSEYDLKIGDVGGIATGDILVSHIQTSVYLRPVAEGSYLEWIATSPAGAPALMRSALGFAAAPITVSTFGGETVVGPSSAPSMTLIGTMAPNMPPRLQAFAR